MICLTLNLQVLVSEYGVGLAGPVRWGMVWFKKYGRVPKVSINDLDKSRDCIAKLISHLVFCLYKCIAYTEVYTTMAQCHTFNKSMNTALM